LRKLDDRRFSSKEELRFRFVATHLTQKLVPCFFVTCHLVWKAMGISSNCLLCIVGRREENGRKCHGCCLTIPCACRPYNKTQPQLFQFLRLKAAAVRRSLVLGTRLGQTKQPFVVLLSFCHMPVVAIRCSLSMISVVSGLSEMVALLSLGNEYFTCVVFRQWILLPAQDWRHN